MRTIVSLFAAVVCITTACAQTPVIRWDIETGRRAPTPYNLTLRRGEAVNLQPRFLSYDVPMAIASNAVVEWRQAVQAGVYLTNSVPGVAVAGDTGRVSIAWGPWCEGSNATAAYEIAVSGTLLRAYGTLMLLAGVGDPGGGVWPTGQVSASAYSLLNPRLTAVEATVSGIGTGSVDLVARGMVTGHETNATAHAGLFDVAGTASASTGTLATALRGELAAATGAVYAAGVAATVAATGTLGAAVRDYADAGIAAATGTLATALRGDITAATNPLASRAWVEAQGYGTGGGGITQLVATADAAGVPSQLSAVKWGIGTNTTGLGGGSDTSNDLRVYSLSTYIDYGLTVAGTATPDLSGVYLGTGVSYANGIYRISGGGEWWMPSTWLLWQSGDDFDANPYWTSETKEGVYAPHNGASAPVTVSVYRVSYPNVVSNVFYGDGRGLTNLSPSSIAAAGGLTNGTIGASLPGLLVDGQGATWTGGGKTNVLTFDGTNFISTITP